MSARTRFMTATVLILATLMLASGAAAADEAVKLAWKFTKGEKLRYVVDQNTTSEGKFSGQTVKSEVKQMLTMEWVITEVQADGTAQMTQTITRARLNISQPGSTIDYDSESKEAPQGAAGPVAAVFKVLVGKQVKLKMSPRGTISDVTLPEGMADELKKVPGQGPGGSMLNEESFKQMTGASTLEFADHAVKKGDTWQRKATVTNPAAGGKQTTEITYTYHGAEKDDGKPIDKIGMTIKTSLAPPAPGAPQIEIKDQQSEGDVDFDRTAGHTRQSRARVKMAMVISIMGTKIDQTSTNDTTMRLAEGEDDEKASETGK